MNRTCTLAAIVTSMRNRGYVTTFTIQHNNIFCPELNAVIPPDSLTLMERYEVKIKLPGEERNREIYGFRTNENVLGIMTNTYADFDYNGFSSVFGRCRQEQQEEA